MLRITYVNCNRHILMRSVAKLDVEMDKQKSIENKQKKGWKQQEEPNSMIRDVHGGDKTWSRSCH